jgi:TatD DNase family protein
MIDSHAHLDDKQFDADREDVIRRAFEAGVEKIITVGAGLGSSERAVNLAKKYQNIFAVVGLHPEYFMKHGTWQEEHKEKLLELAKTKKVMAIGEIGLEYHTHTDEMVSEEQKEFQKEGFIFQLELATKLKKPVVIHCRPARNDSQAKRSDSGGGAYDDALEIIRNYSEINFVFHCYGGNLEFTEKSLQLENIHFSFTGNITYAKPSAEILEVIRVIPLEKIMLETDCPYLAPVPHRGKRNEPAFVTYVAEKIAEIKEISASEVDRVTTENANKFFNLS